MLVHLNPDVCIMQTTPKFDYLLKVGEFLTVSELRARALFCPAIMDEPELQIMVQCFNDSTIERVSRNESGYWWNFKSKIT